MKRVFKTRVFQRWMRKTALDNIHLINAVEEMINGLIDANLGANLFKKRVALPGRGKSGSTRTLLATNLHDRWFFIYGFEKNQKANITNREKEALQNLAADLLKISDEQLDHMLEKQTLFEVSNETGKPNIRRRFGNGRRP